MTGAVTNSRRVFVRDLVLAWEIGVFSHEHGRKQRVRINVDLLVPEKDAHHDQLHNIVSYSDIVDRIRALAAAGRVNLVETLAERIAALCLDDARVRSARIKVEKLDVYPDAAAVGVEIERFNQNG